MPSPYSIPAPYSSPYGESIADLMVRQGDIAGQRAGASGAIWGQALSNLGQIVGGAIEKHQERKEQSKRDEALSALIQSDVWATDPQAAFAASAKILGPREGPKFAEGMFGAMKMRGAQSPEEARQSLPMMARGLAAAPTTMKPQLYGAARSLMVNAGLVKPEEMPEQWSDDMLPMVKALAGEEKAEQGFSLGPGQTRFGPGGEVIAALPAEPTKPPTLQHVETAAGIQTFNPQTGQLGSVIARGKPPASLIVNPQTTADRREIAESIVNGTVLPSQLSRRGADFNATIAQANRLNKEKNGKPFNFAKAQLDYESAKRFVSGMNSPQMIRFKGLAGSVVNTMDEVKALAEELKQGGVQRWNQAKRDTILQVYGNTSQSALAARYVSAVNTLKEEFANLAQGGYAPTEDAWKLAEQQINGNFGLKDMEASLTEAQRLINYRLGAFEELGPSFIGGAGPTGAALGGSPTKPAETGAPAGDWITLPGGIRIREKR